MRLERLLIGALVAGIALSARSAAAQEAVVQQALKTDAADADAVQAIEGYGYSVAPGVVTHPSIGILGGVNDNVFYQSSNSEKQAAGLLRVVGGLFVATDKVRATDDGEGNAVESTPRAYEFRGGIQAGFTEYVGGSDAVNSQRNLSLNAAADLVVFPAGDFSFLVRDRFIRDVRPPNFEDTETQSRDNNFLSLGLRYQPYGHDIGATLHYDNTIDVFEAGFISTYANRMNQSIGLRGEWQWRPFTKFLADVSYGFYGPLGTSTLGGMPYKTGSNPLRAVVGASTLLTLNTSIKAHVGYAQASYGVGAGYIAPVGGIEVGYRWSDNGRIVALYDYDHFDSFNANFYSDHTVAIRAVQQINSAVIDVGPEVRLRQFGGIPKALGAPDRTDFVAGVRARFQWVFNEKFSLTAEYRLAIVQTDYRSNVFTSTGAGMGTDNPSFVQDEVTVGFRAAY